MRRSGIVGFLFVVIFCAGCTRVVVNKDPGPHDKGFRFNRPKPYLYIGPISQPGSGEGGSAGPSAAPAPAAEPGKGSGVGKAEPAKSGGGQGQPDGSKAPLVTDNNFIKVGIQLRYLPDYGEEYSIKLRPGLGIGNLSFNLQDGWNLTSVNMQTNQEVPEILNSVANLVGAVGGLGAGGAGGAARKAKSQEGAFRAGGGDEMNIIVDSRQDVPLGFYEAIIATDPHGRKSLFGWRYVGFMPFSGCPVAPCARPQVVDCSLADLWGLVATPNSIKFDRLSSIEAGYKPDQTNWPYRYYPVKETDVKVPGGTPAPPFPTLAPTTTGGTTVSVGTKTMKFGVLSAVADRSRAATYDFSIKLIPDGAGDPPRGEITFILDEGSSKEAERGPAKVELGETAKLPGQGPITEGEHDITVKYSGDDIYAPAKSGPHRLKIPGSLDLRTVLELVPLPVENGTGGRDRTP